MLYDEFNRVIFAHEWVTASSRYVVFNGDGSIFFWFHFVAGFQTSQFLEPVRPGSDLTISSMAGRVFVQFQNRGKREESSMPLRSKNTLSPPLTKTVSFFGFYQP